MSNTVGQEQIRDEERVDFDGRICAYARYGVMDVWHHVGFFQSIEELRSAIRGKQYCDLRIFRLPADDEPKATPIKTESPTSDEICGVAILVDDFADYERGEVVNAIRLAVDVGLAGFGVFSPKVKIGKLNMTKAPDDEPKAKPMPVELEKALPGILKYIRATQDCIFAHAMSDSTCVLRCGIKCHCPGCIVSRAMAELGMEVPE